MNASRTRPPGAGPRSAAAAPSAAIAGVPASTFRKLRRPSSICSGVRFIPLPLERGTVAGRERIHNRSSSGDGPGAKREQHEHRARLDQVLVDEEIGAFGANVGAAGGNGRQVEGRQQRQRAAASELREQPEHQAQRRPPSARPQSRDRASRSTRRCPSSGTAAQADPSPPSGTPQTTTAEAARRSGSTPDAGASCSPRRGSATRPACAGSRATSAAAAKDAMVAMISVLFSSVADEPRCRVTANDDRPFGSIVRRDEREHVADARRSTASPDRSRRPGRRSRAHRHARRPRRRRCADRMPSAGQPVRGSMT